MLSVVLLSIPTKTSKKRPTSELTLDKIYHITISHWFELQSHLQCLRFKIKA